MSGEDKAREVLWAEPWMASGQSISVPEIAAIRAMLTFGEQCREEGRLAALDEAAGVARGWPHHPAAIEIVRRIEALKDQK